MEEFDSEDFSTSEEDEDYVPSGGEYSEDDVNELVKEDEVDGEEQTQKAKGKKRKAQSIPARKRKQGGFSLEEEEEEDANEESEGNSSEEEDAAAEQEKGIGSEDARKKKEDELWASFLNDVGPKPKVPPNTQVKRGEKPEETSSSKLLVRAEELEKPKETEKVKITKVFDFAGEEVRVTKEVDATSKEAKSFFKQNEKEKPQATVPAPLPSLPAGSGFNLMNDPLTFCLRGKLGPVVLRAASNRSWFLSPVLDIFQDLKSLYHLHHQTGLLAYTDFFWGEVQMFSRAYQAGRIVWTG
ncbi:craniofacial development protein 1 isoform X4 [Vulpes vulpes]|uniref:Craniofacial development protein 1 isoform X4 n=1 Tax=Vulpes vulpes TaxID=9627 RepID=A0ABM4YBE7_VULVU